VCEPPILEGHLLSKDDLKSNYTMNKYIVGAFDLDFCKIIFDGININKYDNNSVATKTCTFSISKCNRSDVSIGSTFHRIRKYASRGYDTIITK
jgi:hypothetical protein